MKHSTTPALKECHSVGASLCSLHVPTGFVGRAGSEVSVAHIFPWDLLVIITLVGGETDVGETRDRTRCENGLLFYSVAVSALPGVNWCQKCWNRSRESKGKIGYTPLDAWCPSNGNFDLVDNSTGATEAKSGPWCEQLGRQGFYAGHRSSPEKGSKTKTLLSAVQDGGLLPSALLGTQMDKTFACHPGRTYMADNKEQQFNQSSQKDSGSAEQKA